MKTGKNNATYEIDLSHSDVRLLAEILEHQRGDSPQLTSLINRLKNAAGMEEEEPIQRVTAANGMTILY